MGVLRYTTDIYGQDLLVGVSWDLLWVPILLAAITVVLHQLMRMRLRGADA